MTDDFDRDIHNNINTGDTITVKYTTTHGNPKEVTGEVMRVERHPTVSYPFTEIYFYTEDANRSGFYLSEPNRRLTVFSDINNQLDGKNGGRWNRLSAHATNPTIK